MKRNSIIILLIAVAVFLSRLPFINAGYGSEEDAWGLALTAEKISSQGHYEVSRLPGHPFQEIVYAFIWPYEYIYMNLITVLISTAGILFFIAALQKLKIESAFASGIALAFVPVIYINSQNVMDYTWAMSGILAAFYFLTGRKYIISGIFLGLAIGCRITSGAMLLPFVIYILQAEKDSRFIKVFLHTVAVLIVSVICFIPVINEYGLSFFTYYEHFPIPSFFKNFYKGTFGV